jgi:TatA/E family protein of Tat protein translocase
MFNFLSNISPTELIIIAVIIVVLFGARILVGMAKTSGETFKEIKKVKKVFTETLKDDDKVIKN